MNEDYPADVRRLENMLPLLEHQEQILFYMSKRTKMPELLDTARLIELVRCRLNRVINEQLDQEREGQNIPHYLSYLYLIMILAVIIAS